MSKFQDWRIKREAKREFSGQKTSVEWMQDKFIKLQAKRELKKLEKQQKRKGDDEK